MFHLYFISHSFFNHCNLVSARLATETLLAKITNSPLTAKSNRHSPSLFYLTSLWYMKIWSSFFTTLVSSHGCWKVSSHLVSPGLSSSSLFIGSFASPNLLNLMCGVLSLNLYTLSLGNFNHTWGFGYYPDLCVAHISPLTFELSGYPTSSSTATKKLPFCPKYTPPAFPIFSHYLIEPMTSPCQTCLSSCTVSTGGITRIETWESSGFLPSPTLSTSNQRSSVLPIFLPNSS